VRDEREEKKEVGSWRVAVIIQTTNLYIQAGPEAIPRSPVRGT
jgi:hypothetical protein